MKNLASVDQFRNKIFATSSGNFARFEILGPGGIRVVYHLKPSDEDIKEVNSFMSRLTGGAKVIGDKYLGPKSDSATLEAESKTYTEFLKKDEEPQ